MMWGCGHDNVDRFTGQAYSKSSKHTHIHTCMCMCVCQPVASVEEKIPIQLPGVLGISCYQACWPFTVEHYITTVGYLWL